MQPVVQPHTAALPRSAGRMGRHSSVPANARLETPAGSQLVHGDRLISAALIAEVDRLYHHGAITIGRAESTVIPAAAANLRSGWNELNCQWVGYSSQLGGQEYESSGSVIWNKGGDCVYLRNSVGSLVDSYCY